MIATQVLFSDKEEDSVQAGIKLSDGTVVCACCGGIFEPEDYTLIEEYEDWEDISDFIR